LTVVTSDSCEAHACAVVFVGYPVDTFYYGCQAMFYTEDLGTDSLGNPIGDSLTLLFVDESFGNPEEWTWEFGDGNTSSEQNPVHSYDQPGVYVVELSILTETGCESNISFEICVGEDCPWDGEQDCQALFIPLPDSLGGTGFGFLDLSFSPNPIVSWTWNFGDGSTSTEQNPFHEYDQPGIYTVTLRIEADSCDSEISFELNTEEPWNFANQVATLNKAGGSTSAVATLNNTIFEMRVYPNPAQRQLFVGFKAEQAEPYEVQVADLTGRILGLSRGNTVAGINLIPQGLTQLVPGMYILTMRTAQRSQTLKFVKQQQ